MERKLKICEICSENPQNCSVSCYKNHQDTPCQRNHEDNKSNAAGSKPTILFPTEDTVSEEKLIMLQDSEELKMLLKNSHLRELLRELDAALNAEKAMAVAMQEPLFMEFADQVLKIVEPQKDDT
uniref:Putative mynd zn-finger protein/hormone receptor interactor n=1 Tax=Lutzomyia longipalpis TaxID=7200 RepID=A0A1B0CV54_LUTLO